MRSQPLYKLLLPKSIPGLLVTGFVIVAIPLVLANMRAFLVVDSLSDKSESLVVAGVEMIRDSEITKEELIGLDRIIRQYQVIENPEMLIQFSNLAAQAVSRLQLLHAMVTDPDTADMFAGIGNRLEELASPFHPPHDEPVNKQAVERIIAELPQLRETMWEATVDTQRLVNRQLQTLRQSAGDARASVFWQSVSVLTVTLILVMLITFFINRPIRQTIHAIRGLGHGDFKHKVSIDGPAELTSLGDELNWLRVRLDEADVEKDRFMKRISHDLKTPLASIREGVELLHDELIGDLNEEQREVCTIIRDSSVTLQTQIENLLNYRLSDALDDESQQVQQFRVNDVIKTIRNQHRLTLLNHGIVLSVDGGGTQVIGDRERLRIAIDNLVSNAIKVSPANSSIRVVVRERNGAWEIDVRDQGPGVSRKDRKLIFKPFYQGQAPQHSQINGTGLGLSVARECIEAQGGTLELIDDAPSGACFRIRLPNQVLTRASIADKEKKDNAANYQNHHPAQTRSAPPEAVAKFDIASTGGSSEPTASVAKVSNASKANDQDATPIDSPHVSRDRAGCGVVRTVDRKAAAS